jgi:hypothetical protein
VRFLRAPLQQERSGGCRKSASVRGAYADVSRVLEEAGSQGNLASEAMREAVAKAGKPGSVEGAFARAEERSKEIATRLRGSTARCRILDRLMNETGKKSRLLADGRKDLVSWRCCCPLQRCDRTITSPAGEIRCELDMTFARN